VWGPAQEVPGLHALNAYDEAQVVSVSCASPGNCAAGGYYTNGSGTGAFLSDERNGVWASAERVPGLDPFTPQASINAISCVATGVCAAVGYYEDAHFGQHAFVIDEANGTWGSLESVTGVESLTTVSCRGVGQCAAGGQGVGQAGPIGELVDEVGGTWGTPTAVHVPAGLTATDVESVSCAAPGDCTATGRGNQWGYVATESGGTWGTASPILGLSSLNVGGATYDFGLSCAAVGDCALGGTYTGSGGVHHEQGLVADEATGVWGSAQPIAGLSPSSTEQLSFLWSISCGAPGECAAGGYYEGTGGHDHGWIVNETNGHWGSANDVPGLGALNVGGYAEVRAVACATDSSCALIGDYSGPGGGAFVADEPGPAYCSPSTGLTAVITRPYRSDAHEYYRILLTNRGGSACLLVGIPGAIALSIKEHRMIGPPARRTSRPDRGGTIDLAPNGGRAEVTFVVDVAPVTRVSPCHPKAVDAVTLRPTGVPHILVPFVETGQPAVLVCTGLQNEAIYGFGPVSQSLT
jgi:hypothetical protein